MLPGAPVSSGQPYSDSRSRAGSGSCADQTTFVTDCPGHDARHAIDPIRIRAELGWRPGVTVEEGLERTVQLYLDNERWWRALQKRQGVGVRLGMAEWSMTCVFVMARGQDRSLPEHALGVAGDMELCRS